MAVSTTANEQGLAKVAEIEEQSFNFAQKFNQRTKLKTCTKPAILPNCCYAQCFFSIQTLSFVHYLLVSFHL